MQVSVEKEKVREHTFLSDEHAVLFIRPITGSAL